MFSYATLKALHLLGHFLLFLAIGGMLVHAVNGGTRATNAGRRLAGVTHGIALVLILVAGFALLPRIGVGMSAGLPPWVWGKVAIWLVLGGVTAVIGRRPAAARPLWLLLPFLGGAAALLALFKPGG